jgi:hypothetical protein
LKRSLIKKIITGRLTGEVEMSNMFVSKWRVNEGAKRAEFGVLALAMCKLAKIEEGVSDARFYWCDANTIGFVIEAEAGCWGPGSKLAGATNKSVFDLADIAQVISDEVWMSAKVGEMNYNSSH